MAQVPLPSSKVSNSLSRTPLDARHPLLTKPLHVYTLPSEILEDLSVRSLRTKDDASLADDHASEDGSSISSSSSSSSSSGSSRPMEDILEESSLAARPTAAEEEDDLSSAQFLSNRFALRSAVIWLTPSPSVFPSTQLGVYRALFPSELTSPSAFIPRLKDLQLTQEDLEGGEEKERRWIMLMVAGGHFAGMVISLGGKRVGKRVIKGQMAEVKVLKHKTFHRYTTRKKQGGSQSKNDNANGAANSIGAQLRRAGEVQLNEDIRSTLENWAEDFKYAERVFIRASVSGKKSFWGYEGAVIDKNDERIRTFPFPTRRPTLTELLRCYHELTRVKLSFLSDDVLAELEASYIASLKPKALPSAASQQAPPAAVKPIKPKLSEQEERSRERWRRLLEMIRKGKVETLSAFWDKWATEMGLKEGDQDFRGELPDWLREEEGKTKEATLLMVAVVAGQEDVVKYLLEEKNQDPTVPVPIASFGSASRPPSPEPTGESVGCDAEKESTTIPTTFRTAYDLSPNKAIRSVFRRVAYTKPSLWDWTSTQPGGARVPSGLSAEMEEEQDRKKGERRKGLKDKMKARKEKGGESAVVVDEVVPPVQQAAVKKEDSIAKKGPQRLGGGAGDGSAGGNSLAGLTPEVRMRIERERRARAAEARMAGR
ncbi:Ankyrin repeat protein [Phaffia rhodozyma]|uniref:Ankyrin repeat protein n=1 Tax=Phaffia rhodozyma TaxID=264483 RepID=A0A0F7SG23_PHARH|nr:Ankyrin repeat protein [Phaffia rhodozyma]